MYKIQNNFLEIISQKKHLGTKNNSYIYSEIKTIFTLIFLKKLKRNNLKKCFLFSKRKTEIKLFHKIGIILCVWKINLCLPFLPLFFQFVKFFRISK